MNEQAPHPLQRLYRYADIYHGRIFAASCYSVLNKIFDLAPPVLIGMAIDLVVQQESSFLAGLGFATAWSQLVALTVLTVVIWGLESLFEYAYAIRWRGLAQSLQHGLRIDAYAHTQKLGLRYFEDEDTGRLLSVLNDDINQLERFLDGGANDVLQVVTTVVVIGAAYFYISPMVAALSFLPVPLIVWGSFRFQKRIAPRYQEVRQHVGLLSGQLAGNLGGIATIKSFAAEDREVARISAQSLAYLESNNRAIRLSSAFSPLIRMAIVIGFTATLAYGGVLALRGDLAVGAYSILVFLTQRLLWPLTKLGSTFDLYQRAMASTERVLDLLARPVDIETGSVRLEEVRGEIRFEKAGFRYREALPFVLKDIDLQVVPGETVAVVGATGSGKTTLIKLLARFYDLSEGALRLDGHHVQDLDLGDYRRAIGLVSQDVFLFHGTVRENIAYGKPDAPASEVEQAARAAEAHDFIAALPKGYDTLVGERGQKLSGGQRQRIALARAIVKNPPILVLDEATSAVDNETEAAIQRSLEHITVGRSTLVIAHRLSTIRHASRIYVLDHGRISEVGTHDELLQKDGIYKSLWCVQTGERIAC